MSNSIGNKVLHQSFLPWTVLEPRSRINSTSTGKNTLFSPQATSAARKSPISTEFHGSNFTVNEEKLSMGKERGLSSFPRAVLATDPSSQVIFYFSVELTWYSFLRTFLHLTVRFTFMFMRERIVVFLSCLKLGS